MCKNIEACLRHKVVIVSCLFPYALKIKVFNIKMDGTLVCV